MKGNKRLAGVGYSEAQCKWLKKEAVRIGDSQAAVQRSLVQDRIQAEKAIADKAGQILN